MGETNPAAEMAIKEQVRQEEKAPVAAGSALVPTKRMTRAVVDCEKEIAVQVLYSTVVFRPNQEIRDPRLLAIAKENGIPIRYK